MRGAEDEFPTTEMQPPAVSPPTSSWVFGVTTSCCEPAGHPSHIISSSWGRNIGGLRQGRARTVIQRGTHAVRGPWVPQPGPRLQFYQTQILLILQPLLLYLWSIHCLFMTIKASEILFVCLKSLQPRSMGMLLPTPLIHWGVTRDCFCLWCRNN